MKKIFIVDWGLIALFIITAISGFAMHISGNRFSHDLWHNWAVVHTLASALFLIASVMHIEAHWGWYKGWLKMGFGKRSMVTALVSVIFILVAITGTVLLVVVDGANSGIGLWHYRIGILFTLFALVHIIKRIPILRKSLK